MANKELEEWLKTQPQEFIEEVISYEDELGNGLMTIDELRELDDKYNFPEE